ncbi:short-chain dehydrogenase TIC 32, chloroplastic-like [Mucor ambiguus]|uniref:Short-chain dehydrogenase TIC 32, chloroplastic-like n=1 Tax=Mucor ambiguus TaxID=91626 RepID=A0A0C9MRH5_9FUNG|nr:short-chain dehydrogenase TIC 32, chloroplastic-like [Mucor ambiguus]
MTSTTTTTDPISIEWNTTADGILQFYKTDLTGKVVIVTGANSGVGLETARALSSVGAKVIIPCRTMEKSQQAIQYIKNTVPNADLVPLVLDLSDLSSIKSFSATFLGLSLPLDILINNAGVMGSPQSYTRDGFETQFGINYVGHFYLTSLLTEKLKESAPSRVVNVSSSGNSLFLGPEGINFDDLNGEKAYSPYKNYGQSKLANILHAKELQRQFDAEKADITVTSLHPGSVETNLMGRYASFSTIVDMIWNIRNYKVALSERKFRKQVDVGASTNVYCAVSPDVIKGEFYSNNAVNVDLLNEQANNRDMAKRLWDITENMIFEKTSNLK